jgi:ArsR family transcriptional regulator
MKRKTRQHPVTDHLSALSDPVRLRLLRILEREELAVGEAARVLQLPQSTISRHLKTLSECAWVARRAEGTATLYRMVLDDLSAGHRALWVAVRDMARADGTHPPAEVDEDLRRLASVLAERRQDAQSFFGRVAGQWDDVRTELFGAVFTLRALLHFLPREWTVADLGCGTGNVSEILAPLVKRVHAVDSSEVMLDAARKRLRVYTNITYHAGHLEATGLERASVDAAASVLVMCYVPDLAAAAKEMHEIVRPGGRAVIVDMAEHDRVSYKHTLGHRWLGMPERAMTDALQKAGFRDVRYTRLPDDPEARGPGLFVCTGVRVEKSRG